MAELNTIIKRDGRKVPFNLEKIASAINKAFNAIGKESNGAHYRLASDVYAELISNGDKIDNPPTVEEVQDIVERVLIANNYADVAKEYIIYRSERNKIREMKSDLMETFKEVAFADAEESDMKRSNANINGQAPMGAMLIYGSEAAKEFYSKFVMKPEHARAHKEGYIHVHDLDFAITGTTTCCQIDLIKLFNDGFHTGHGFLREPNSIMTYSALACIAIQSNQNTQHGGQSIVNFDYSMAEGVKKSYKNHFKTNLKKALYLIAELSNEDASTFSNWFVKDSIHSKNIRMGFDIEKDLEIAITNMFDRDLAFYAHKVASYAQREALMETDRECYQAMEALIHNLNTMHSRAGAQTPFSSINYGLDTSKEGRMAVKNLLLATEAGLGHGETPIFPIQIYRVMDGINYNPEDPNYDLFKLAIRCSCKRLFPNFSFQGSSFNLPYYKPGHPETEIAYMGCRTRVIGNTYDPTREISNGRGNLSFTSINLPMIAIESEKSILKFYKKLDKMIDICIDQLLDRFEFQSHKKVKNFPFLMGQHTWIDSEKLDWEDEVGEVLKHGTLSVGFVGLAEALYALTGKHHAEDPDIQKLGLEIISHMRKRMDEEAEKRKLNFSLLATPAESLCGTALNKTIKKYGIIEGVTDKEYYTNSFHCPVYYNISAYDKIKLEAPYHALCNAGHITYIEMDGDPSNNMEAFENVVRCMKESDIGYGAINHPLDRDPICGYSGIIYDECPGCGRKEEGVPFERIRRITGYLVGTLDRFNDAKKAEVRDRVKHNANNAPKIVIEETVKK